MSTSPSSVPHANKRPRSDSNATEQDTPQRSDLWFNDGSVVLQAANVQFKVHQSVLAKHSPIFTDAFGVPHPAGEPSVDGCPIVHLQDSAEDIKHMILALYGDGNYYARTAIPFDAVAAMVRMGRKYDIKQFREEGLRRLKHEFPATLTAWNLIQAQTQFTEIIDNGALVFDIVNLAETTSIESILPLGYYLCTNSIEELKRGKERKDGSVARLSYNAQRVCLLGWISLQKDIPALCYGWLRKIGKDSACKNPKNCGRQGPSIATQLWESATYSTFGIFGNGANWSTGFKQTMCHPCLEYRNDSFNKGRDQLWEALPRYFDLPSWDDLKDFE